MAEEPQITKPSELVRALGARKRDDVLDVLGNEIDPLELRDPWWRPDGFTVVFESIQLEIDYPFTLTEFWQAVAETEKNAINDRDNDARDAAFAEIDEIVETSGVYAVTVADLAGACQLISRKKYSVQERAEIEDHLDAYGFVSAAVPAHSDDWTLIWKAGGSLDHALRELITLRSVEPPKPKPRPVRPRRRTGS